MFNDFLQVAALGQPDTPRYTGGDGTVIGMLKAIWRILKTRISVGRNCITLLGFTNQSHTAFSQDFYVGWATELAVDIAITSVTGGTTPTALLKISRIQPDGNAYAIYNPAAQSVFPAYFSTSIGAGMATNQSFGDHIRIEIVTTGSPTSFTLEGGIEAK